MTKQEIINQLQQNANKLTQFIAESENDFFEFAPADKWTVGQHLDHLLRSTYPLTKGLKMMKLILKQQFGKPNREGRNYEEVVARYQEKLSKVPKDFTNPIMPTLYPKEEKAKQLERYQEAISELIKAIDKKWKESDMDKILLPHPLLGKVTVREMLYFTIYHNEHHHKLIENYTS